MKPDIWGGERAELGLGGCVPCVHCMATYVPQGDAHVHFQAFHPGARTMEGVREATVAGGRGDMAARAQRECPMCGLRYANVRQHLLKRHFVFNRAELRLLLNLANNW